MKYLSVPRFENLSKIFRIGEYVLENRSKLSHAVQKYE